MYLISRREFPFRLLWLSGCRFGCYCFSLLFLVGSLRRRQTCHDRVEVERSCLLTWRILHVVLYLSSHDRLGQVEVRSMIDDPVPVDVRVEIGALKRVATKIEDVR